MRLTALASRIDHIDSSFAKRMNRVCDTNLRGRIIKSIRSVGCVAAPEVHQYFIFALLAPWNNPAKCVDWNALIVINPSLLRLHLRSVAPFYANLAPIEELQRSAK
ncbi:MAG: hypothetical protein DMG13_32690 [Acidobacteria bacterium]|nr:MAG: hypothetical protein DMG13_32690 [Acidobacteriota bacterium]